MLSIFIFVLALGLMLALQAFVGRTRLGRAMRATAQDREASALMGVDANQTIALTFLLGGTLAAAAGVVWGLRFGYVRFDLGFNSGLKAFTAAVLGGIGNITGAVLGGFVIGFIENFASVARLLALVGVPRVHDPDVRPDLQADRHPRTGIGGPGMTATTQPRADRVQPVAARPHPRLRRARTARPRSSSAWRSSPP